MNGDRNNPDGGRNNHFGTRRPASVTYLFLFAPTVFLLGVLFSLCGCSGSKPSNFYLLHPQTQVPPVSTKADRLDVAIGIGPISIPGYLDRSHIITRAGRYEVKVSEYDRWADSLDESVPRVIAENLSSLLSTDRVYTYPWHVSSPDYQVRMEIIQFDAKIPGNVEFVTRWTLVAGGTETRIDHQRYHNKKPIAGQGYSGMVSTMNLVLYDMSREIAEAVIQDALRESAAKSD